MAMSLADNKRQVIVEGASNAKYLAGGYLLYLRDGTMLARPFDVKRLELTGAAAPVRESFWVLDGTVPQLSVSRAGDLVYLPGSSAARPRVLVWVTRQGVVTRLPHPAGVYADPRLSPDGRRITASLSSSGEPGGDIVVLDATRDRTVRLPTQGLSSSPIWSHDGNNVIYGTVVGAASNLFIQPSSGTARAKRLLEDANNQWAGSLLPDGRTLLYMQNDPRTQGDIWTMSLDGAHAARPVVRGSSTEWGARVSPDGRWLAYVSDERGQFDAYVTSFPDTVAKWLVSSGGGEEVVWARSGKELFYRRHDGSMMAVDVDVTRGFAASAPKLLFSGSFLGGSPGLPAYDVALDGSRFLMLASDSTAAPQRINIVLRWSTELARTVGKPSP